MTRRVIGILLGGLVGVLALAGSRADAGDIRYWHCPKTSYSRLHYWVPEVYIVGAALNPHPRYIYPRDRHPDVPKNILTHKFGCPAVPPAVEPYSWPFANIKPPAPPAPPPQPESAPSATPEKPTQPEPEPPTQRRDDGRPGDR